VTVFPYHRQNQWHADDTDTAWIIADRRKLYIASA